MVVPPPFPLVPVKIHVPVPFLRTLPPPSSPAARLLVSPVLPDKVRVPLTVIGAGLFKVNGPEPSTAIEPPLVPTVNRRLMLATPPVYCNVPPLKTKFAAALLAAPMSLARPPFASAPTTVVPPRRVVTPVLALAPPACGI